MRESRDRQIDWCLIGDLWFLAIGYGCAAMFGFGPAMFLGMILLPVQGAWMWTGIAGAIVGIAIVHRKIWN